MTHAVTIEAAPQPPRRSFAWLRRVVGIAAVLAILYVLSIGPALQLNKRGVIRVETIEKVYFPVLLITLIPGGQQAFEWYLNLWVPEFSQRTPPQQGR